MRVSGKPVVSNYARAVELKYPVSANQNQLVKYAFLEWSNPGEVGAKGMGLSLSMGKCWSTRRPVQLATKSGSTK